MVDATELSRRSFLTTAGLAGLATTVGATPTATTRHRVKNLIFLVADGMCHGTLAAVNHWRNLQAQEDSQWIRLYRDGLAQRGLMEAASATGIVTDSAAAGSAWGSGERILNRRINIDVQGRPLTPISTLAKSAGKQVGLVTTTSITHATPASFAANQENRDDEDEIALQYLEREVDVLLGGGHRYFAPDRREDGQDLYARYATAGYTIARDREALARASTNGKLLGIFSDSHMPYAIDRTPDTALGARMPGLKAMTQAALDRLATAPNGFILQVESGRVDHAGHANDSGAILAEMLEFDALIAEIRAFAAQSPETLVIVTTDHGTGGFMVNGEGAGYTESTERFLHLGGVQTSFEGLAQRHRSTPQSAPAVAASLGLPAEAEYLDPLAAILETWDGHDARRFGREVRDLLAPWYATSWTTQNHTGELVEFAAFGPGSHTFGPFFENWEVHHRLRELMGI